MANTMVGEKERRKSDGLTDGQRKRERERSVADLVPRMGGINEEGKCVCVSVCK